MKYAIVLFFLAGSRPGAVCAQAFNKSLDRDSLLQTIVQDMAEPRKSELLKMYNEGTAQEKEFLLVMYSLPKSSKQAMIANIDSNFTNIKRLKNAFARLVPKGYIVYIEFNPANKIVLTKESIDLSVDRVPQQKGGHKQEWNLSYDSKTLAQMIKPLGWNRATLTTIKQLLAAANCISIANGPTTNIGFARSGMGKYSFLLFDKDLDSEQIKALNGSCMQIFLRKNIVLEYAGGAVGPDCFPD